MHEMNKGLVGAADPLKNDPIMDIFPVLFKFRKFLFNKTHNMLEETIRMSHEHIQERIEEAKVGSTQLHKLTDQPVIPIF